LFFCIFWAWQLLPGKHCWATETFHGESLLFVVLLFTEYYLLNTFPPIILNAGAPLIKVSLAKMASQFGQVQGNKVKSLVMRCLKHLRSDPLPPLRYLNNWVLH
jgi:hypothetical protein